MCISSWVLNLASSVIVIKCDVHFWNHIILIPNIILFRQVCRSFNSIKVTQFYLMVRILLFTGESLSFYVTVVFMLQIIRLIAKL